MSVPEYGWVFVYARLTLFSEWVMVECRFFLHTYIHINTKVKWKLLIVGGGWIRIERNVLRRVFKAQSEKFVECLPSLWPLRDTLLKRWSIIPCFSIYLVTVVVRYRRCWLNIRKDSVCAVMWCTVNGGVSLLQRIYRQMDSKLISSEHIFNSEVLAMGLGMC